jgi:hypothetical protein
MGGVVVTMVLTVLGAGPAHADGSRTLTGPSTGDADVFLTYVGCGDLFGPAAAPQSRINLGPYSAPLGRRSLGLVPSARGTASGPFARFASLTAVGSSLSVASTSGSQGVSYVMSITSTSPPGTAWSGRAALAAEPGSWRSVSAASLAYEWHLLDLTTLDAVSPAGTATPAEFAAEHGDGAGFVVTGFGCDGQPFNLDAVQGAGATFDFEGTALTTTISADRARAGAGERVTITGRVTDPGGRVTGDPLVLESRAPGGEWARVGDAVLGDASGLARTDVPVTETTEFRWHRPESQYADEGWSAPVTVTVDAPSPSETPSEKPSATPTETSTETPTETPPTGPTTDPTSTPGSE